MKMLRILSLMFLLAASLAGTAFVMAVRDAIRVSGGGSIDYSEPIQFYGVAYILLMFVFGLLTLILSWRVTGLRRPLARISEEV